MNDVNNEIEKTYLAQVLNTVAITGYIGEVEKAFTNIIEKGKKANIGEIREWSGQKFRKEASGWVLVKMGKITSTEKKKTELVEGLEFSIGEQSGGGEVFAKITKIDGDKITIDTRTKEEAKTSHTFSQAIIHELIEEGGNKVKKMRDEIFDINDVEVSWMPEVGIVYLKNLERVDFNKVLDEETKNKILVDLFKEENRIPKDTETQKQLINSNAYQFLKRDKTSNNVKHKSKPMSKKQYFKQEGLDPERVGSDTSYNNYRNRFK